jgi:MFS family permease
VSQEDTVSGGDTLAATTRSERGRAFIASLSGTALEWYDFALYSSAAALVLGTLFFPSQDPLSSTLAAFGTYAGGYLARPIGGILFGRLGDVIGRKRVLVMTLQLMGLTTILIGLLPTYSQLGPWAAVLLVTLRLAQGVAVGGEWGGAVLLSSEFGRGSQRGFWASAPQIGPPSGLLLANGMLALLSGVLSPEAFLAWGWRVAFLFSAVIVALGLWIRLRLEETPVFKALASRQLEKAAPVREVFAHRRRELVAATLVRVGPDVLWALCTVFMLTYATQRLDLPRGWALGATMLACVVHAIAVPLAGALSDRVNRRVQYAVGTAFTAVYPFVLFVIVEGRSFGTLLVGITLGMVVHASIWGPQAALISEQFPPGARYTGCSLAWTFGAVIGGAIAPLMFTGLLAQFDSWVPIAWYLVAASALTGVGVWLAHNPPTEEQERTATLAGYAH